MKAAPAVVTTWLALLAFALCFRLSSPALFDDPNDAQYAEVAREMVETGEWVSPQLNYALFLNKPPLLYWMIAASYELLGVGEFAARLPGTLITVVTLLLLYALGRELYDRTTGLLAVCLYASMWSTLLEARFVRPDSLLIAATIGALLSFRIASRREGKARLRALYGLQCALAVGLLAKGMLGLVLPALPIAVLVVAEKRWGMLRELVRPRGWMLLLAILVPWHLAVALRHGGFAWDYIVNQHFLFFLDRKEPRDSIPVSLGVFWAAFTLRTFPWTLLVPAALVSALRRPRGATAGTSGLLVAAWALGTLFLFSVTVSRLEHYSLPALPAVAMLSAALLRRASKWNTRARSLLACHFAALTAAFVTAAWLVPGMLGGIDWLGQAEQLQAISRRAFLFLAAAAALSIPLAWRCPLLAAPALGAAALAAMPFVHSGLVAIAPLDSSKPLADFLTSLPGSREATIVFEAPIEYQSCAGLNFYLRRRVELLRPAGFVEPPYLTPHRQELFIERAELERLWAERGVLFVSDPLAAADRPPAEVVPHPFRLIRPAASRWVATNRVLAATLSEEKDSHR